MSNIQQEMGKLNPYTARVDRAHKSAFVFLIDQSGSMDEMLNFEGVSMSKAEAVANAINSTLGEIIYRCTKSDGIRHYFDITLIGYGGENAFEANFIYQGAMADGRWLSPAELKEIACYRETEQEVSIRGKMVKSLVQTPYWVEPVANWRTPMYDAFSKTETLLSEWCEAQSGEDCYPPVVINITDGLQTDAEDEQMIEIADRIKNLMTMDGNVLLFNIHLSDDDENKPVIFPKSKDEIGDDSYSSMLFEMSSVLPNLYNKEVAGLRGETSGKGFRAMGYNTRADFVRMLNIGTITNLSADE